MDYKNIGEVFKHKLSQRKFEMKNAYWENAEQLIIQSNKKKKNRRAFFLIMAILMLTTSLTWVFNFYNKSVIKSPVVTNEGAVEVIEDVLDDIPPQGNLAADFEEDTEKTPAVTNENTIEEKALDDIPSQNNLVADFEEDAEKAPAVTNEGAVEEKEEVLDDILPQDELATDFEKDVEETPTVTNEGAVEAKVEALDDILPQNNLTVNFNEDSEKPPVGANQVATDVKEDTLNNILPPNNLTADFEDGAEKVSVVTSESTVEMQEEVLPVPTNKDTIITQLANQPDTTGDISKKSPFSLSLYGGILSVNKLLATSNQSFDKHVDRRKSEEQSIISYAVGIELNYHFKNWLISTGIAYNKLGEKINYSPNVNQQTDTIINDNSFWRIATFSYWTTDSIGNPMFVQLTDSNYIEIINTVDTTYTVTDNSIAEQNGITKLTYIEVPVLIGYEFSLKKLSITVRTGVSFGFLMRSKGYYLNRSNDQLLNISATSGLLNSFALSYLLRIGANYKWNETITLFAEPSLNLNFNSVLQKQYGISQKYYTIGFNLGVNYRF